MMTALNMTHEFLTAKVEGGFDFSDFQRKIGNISSTIDAVLQEYFKYFELRRDAS